MLTAAIARTLFLLALVGLAVVWIAISEDDQPTDWDAPAGDLTETDVAWIDVAAMLPDETRGGLS